MRRLTIITFLSGIVGALAILGLLLTSSPAPSAQAVAGTDIAQIAIDLNTSGNTVTACTTANHPTTGYPCNDSTTLGATEVDRRRQVAFEDFFAIDIIGRNIPPGGAIASNLADAGTGGPTGCSPGRPTGRPARSR